MSRAGRAAWFLLVVALVAAVGASYVARGLPLQSNLLAMLPPTERDPQVEEVIARLGSTLAARVAFVVSHAEDAAARRGAETFAAALRANGALRAVIVRLPATDRSAPAELYAAGRFGLLSDEDRAALAGGDFSVRDAALRQLVLPLPQG
ncbi:MAG: MMPL family transporter, partial [Burkholderiales bacterium]